MTPSEFEYLERAMAALRETPTMMAQVKIQKTMAQILLRDAQRIEEVLLERFDAKMERNYQDRQNEKLIDILSN
jgi:hypothetical protein